MRSNTRRSRIVAMAGKSKAITIPTQHDRPQVDIVWAACWNRDPQIRATNRCSQAGGARNLKMRADWRCPTTREGRRPASSAPSVTSRGVSTSCAAAAARAIRFVALYLSLEDPLLRIFGGEQLGVIVQKLKMRSEPIEHPINRSIARRRIGSITQLRHPQATARIRRRRQRPAARHLSATQRAARGR
jgi:hypothetical protein